MTTITTYNFFTENVFYAVHFLVLSQRLDYPMESKITLLKFRWLCGDLKSRVGPNCFSLSNLVGRIVWRYTYVLGMGMGSLGLFEIRKFRETVKLGKLIFGRFLFGCRLKFEILKPVWIFWHLFDILNAFVDGIAFSSRFVVIGNRVMVHFEFLFRDLHIDCRLVVDLLLEGCLKRNLKSY